MNLFERAIRFAESELKDFGAAHLPPVAEALKHGAKRVGDGLNRLLTEAEQRTFSQDKSGTSPFENPAAPKSRTSPPSPLVPYSEFRHFTKVLKAGGITDNDILKLTDIAHQRGFTPELRDWLVKSENKPTILLPFTRLLADRSQPETIRDKVFFRAKNLGLQEDLLAWLKTEPNLVDSVGMAYANFYAQIKKRAPACLASSEQVILSDADISEARRFAKKISNELRAPRTSR